MTLTPVTRPNGKIYRPRKPPRVAYWTDSSDDTWPAVLGTHDVALAAAYADLELLELFGLTGDNHRLEWWRSGYSNGSLCWLDDPERGVPAVVFDPDCGPRP